MKAPNLQHSQREPIERSIMQVRSRQEEARQLGGRMPRHVIFIRKSCYSGTISIFPSPPGNANNYMPASGSLHQRSRCFRCEISCREVLIC
jgi:hypothetical protein